MALFISDKYLIYVFIITIMISAMEAQTPCSSAFELESSAPIGESVYFYICGASYPGFPLSIQSDSGLLVVTAGNLTEDWYWESIGSGDGSYIKVTFTITAAEDYGTYAILYTREDKIGVTRDLTISHQGPPQLCETEDLSSVHNLSAPIGSSDSSTLCVVSGSALTLSNVQPPTCQGKTTDTSTFDVTAVQNTSNPVVYELEFLVSNLTVADIGQWTVNVNNDDGRLTIEVNVEAVGPPIVCDASQDLSLYLECEGSTTSVFIFSQDALDWEVDELTSAENSSCTSSLGVNIETKDATSLTQEHVVTATCDEASTWTVTVINSYGELEIDVAVGNCTIPGATTPATGSDEENSGDGGSINWLALGIGLALGVTVIVFTAAVVFLVRKNKKLNVKKARNGSIDGESRQDVDRTMHDNYMNLTGLQQTSNYATINDADAKPTQSRSGQVVATPSDEYLVPNGGEMTSQSRPDHAEATPGEYVTIDSELPTSNSSDQNVPTTSRYETVPDDFPFTRATRTISGGTSDRGQPGMTSGPYDLCNSEDIEPPNVYQRMDNGSYVNHAIGRESGGARETYANVASA